MQFREFFLRNQFVFLSNDNTFCEKFSFEIHFFRQITLHYISKILKLTVQILKFNNILSLFYPLKGTLT